LEREQILKTDFKNYLHDKIYIKDPL
jgi:hypothetical protein